MINWHRLAIVTGIVIVLVTYVRHDFAFPLITIIPFVSDEPCLQYDIGGLIMCLITARAARTLLAQRGEHTGGTADPSGR